MTRREFLRWSIRGAAAIALADACVLEPRWIEWTNVPLVPRGNATTPAEFIQISDLHLKSLDGVLISAADKINAINPDLLFFTGDSVDRTKDLPVLEEFLDILDLAIPKIAILGNWEYWGKIDLAQLNKIYERHNCRLFINTSDVFMVQDKRVLVTGIDDFIGGKADLKVSLEHYKDNDYHIVLNHCPEYRDYFAQNVVPLPKIDAVLSGHTHGGQINLFGFIPVLPPGSGMYVKGWYEASDPPVYVSRGIGYSGVPARFGSRPEITTFKVSV